MYGTSNGGCDALTVMSEAVPARGGGVAQCTSKAPTDLLVFCKWDFVVSSAASCGLEEGTEGETSLPGHPLGLH